MPTPTTRYLVEQSYQVPEPSGAGLELKPVHYIDMPDMAASDRASTVFNLISGQYDHPVRVIALDPDGTWHDASEAIAREIAGRLFDSGEAPSPELRNFIEEHAGVHVANELERAA